MRDNHLYQAIQNSDEKAFELLFDRYYERLCNFSLQYSIPKENAEEIVSDIFLKLWNQRKTNQINYLKSFLYTSVKNNSINWLKSKRHKTDLKSDNLSLLVNKEGTQENTMILTEELISIQKVIDRMPKQRRIIFMLNRIDGLKYKEIAKVLDLSVYTIQNQMIKAIKFLHEQYPR